MLAQDAQLARRVGSVALAVIEIAIAVRGELRGRELVAQIGFGVVLALLVIALNSIIH